MISSDTMAEELALVLFFDPFVGVTGFEAPFVGVTGANDAVDNAVDELFFICFCQGGIRDAAFPEVNGGGAPFVIPAALTLALDDENEF